MEKTEALFSIIKNVIEDAKTNISENDIMQIYEFAKMHRMENFVFRFLEKMGTADKYPNICENYMRYISIDANQEYYLNHILAIFEINGINHMALKGSVIKYIYPTPELRESADIDIWIEPNDAKRAKQLLDAEGFKTVKYGISNHDVYCINNIIYVELHKELVSKKFQWYGICNSIVRDCKKEDGYNYRYKMSDEDFYVFMLIHMAKHILYGGAGIRLVLDVWVYLRTYRLNQERLAVRLKEADLLMFDKTVKLLCDYWFNDKQVTDAGVLRLSDYMIHSGWNGTSEQVKLTNSIRESENNHTHLHRYVKSIFWSKNKMAVRYPILNKFPVLLPAMWVHRIVNALFRKKGSLTNFVHYYDDIKENDISTYKSFVSEIGLTNTQAQREKIHNCD